MKDKENPSEYLKRKGWYKHPGESPWCWSLPPCPGRFLPKDAVSTQEGLDKAKKERKP